ncbi:RNA polymerase III transcription factor IIIC subunit-domain-containing protein [Blakeslea trispora]|nr:RNA polymerase III transcription factor IIIC subunit-domain-containing protein [Blakeslea trispora]
MSNYDPAPVLPVGPQRFFCVEFPGHVKRPERAIKMIGGQKTLAEAITNNSVVELRYRDTNTFAHPIRGDIIPSSKLLVKITRRVKKNKPVEEKEEPYQLEMLGVINKTLRFRALADFQYHVPSENRIRQLKEALMKGTLNKIIDFRISLDEKETELNHIPPPAFTPFEQVFDYNYRQNAPVLRVRVRQPDGSFQVKLINKARYVNTHVTAINFEEETVPTKSWHTLAPLRLDLQKETIKALSDLFEERPVWSRFALRNLLDVRLHKYIRDSLVHIAYTFQSGPWRECWFKYGVDPRKDPAYHIYQHIDVRRINNLNASNRPFRHIKRSRPDLGTPSIKPEPVEVPPESFDNKHIFDGKRIPGVSSGYQLCDIQDPDLIPLIHKPEYRKPTCSKYSGYYYDCVVDRIRRYIRAKSHSLTENGFAEPIVGSEDGLMEEIQKETERVQQMGEVEEIDLMVREKAVAGAMELSQSNRPLKEMADQYIEELEQSKDFGNKQ